MAKFKDAPGFLGSLLTSTGSAGGGQAEITPLAFAPTMLCVAAAIMIIEKKFNDIQELQREILDFLKAKEKANLRGNINTLSDVLNNYKFNWNNEKYKTNKHILVQDIRKDSEQSILLYSPSCYFRKWIQYLYYCPRCAWNEYYRLNLLRDTTSFTAVVISSGVRWNRSIK